MLLFWKRDVWCWGVKLNHTPCSENQISQVQVRKLASLVKGSSKRKREVAEDCQTDQIELKIFPLSVVKLTSYIRPRNPNSFIWADWNTNDLLHIFPDLSNLSSMFQAYQKCRVIR